MKNNIIDIRDACFGEIYKIMKRDKDVLFLSDDMDAFILQKIRRDFPKQYLNVGVAEQNLMDVAAGLASCGKKVFVYGICSYITSRCFEQIRFSIASMKLPVVIIGVGAGYSFSFDGPTHHGTGDIAMMRTIPEIEIFNPCDAISSRESVKYTYRSKNPAYLRLDKGILPNFYTSTDSVKSGYKIIKPLKDTNIISTGYMTHRAIDVYETLNKTKKQIGIVDVSMLKPINIVAIIRILKKTKKLFILEENSITGGMGSIIYEIALNIGYRGKIVSLASKDRQFFKYGSRDYLLKLNKLDSESIQKVIQLA